MKNKKFKVACFVMTFVIVFNTVLSSFGVVTARASEAWVVQQILYNITGEMTSDFITSNGAYKDSDWHDDVRNSVTNSLNRMDKISISSLAEAYNNDLTLMGNAQEFIQSYITLVSQSAINSISDSENSKLTFDLLSTLISDSSLGNASKFLFKNIVSQISDGKYSDLLDELDSLDTDEAKQVAIDAYWENYINSQMESSDIQTTWYVDGYCRQDNLGCDNHFTASGDFGIDTSLCSYFRIGGDISGRYVVFYYQYRNASSGNVYFLSLNPFMYGGTFTRYYDNGEISTFSGKDNYSMESSRVSTNIPLFSDRETLLAYFNGSIDRSAAINYEDNNSDFSKDEFSGYVNNRFALNNLIKQNTVTDEEEINYYTEVLTKVLDKLPENYTEDDLETAIRGALEDTPGSTTGENTNTDTDTDTENPTTDGAGDSKIDFSTLFLWLSRILAAITGLPKAIFDLFETLIVKQVALVVTGITTLRNSIVGQISDIISGVEVVKNILTNILQTALGIAEDMGMNIDVLQNILDILKNLSVIDILLEGFTSLLQAVKDFADSVTDGFAKAWENVKELADIITIGFEDLIEWAKSAGISLVDIWDRLGEMAISIPAVIADVIDWLKSLADIGELIGVKLGDIADFLIIDPALISDAIAEIVDPFDLVFSPLKIYLDKFMGMNIEYPKITMQTPDILKQFYKQDVIVYVDFEDWKTQCAWVRTLLSFSFWLGFAYSFTKRIRPALHIG